mmetsp:Transcript_3759/g.8230  ORF Transcript_3759/g.8230 Transcript_3759/m.8230 type:complete len:90 (+) Transcript_3759:765-1034(+)
MTAVVGVDGVMALRDKAYCATFRINVPESVSDTTAITVASEEAGGEQNYCKCMKELLRHLHSLLDINSNVIVIGGNDDVDVAWAVWGFD